MSWQVYMIIPYIELNKQIAPIRAEIDRAIADVIDRSDFVAGEAVARFERAFAEYCGARNCVGVSNGTMAMFLSLKALGVSPGDEVITAANTFVATVEAIAHTGARPVLVDVDPMTCTIDPNLLEAAISPRTKAVIPVHLYGFVCDMKAIQDICAPHSVAVVEDAAQAHGAIRDGRRAGSIGRAGTFSFYPAKNLGAFGDAGAVVTHDERLAERIRKLRDHGSLKKYVHEVPGFNARLNGIQAAVLSVKLKYLDEWNRRRMQIAELYNEQLSGLPIDTPPVHTDGRHVYHVYSIMCDNRDDLRAFLTERGIGTLMHYPVPVHLQKSFEDLGYDEGAFPITERCCRRQLSLPMFPELTDEQVVTVATAVREFFD
jgi:dTDP-4-amino-4,6-dideoxygalactose transaminase